MTLTQPVVHAPTPTAGAPGVGFLDAAQTALSVVWSRSRAAEPSVYSPDAQGLYSLCHGLLGGSPVTQFNAKEGVLVEPGAGGQLQLQGVAANGPGVLQAPLRMGPGNAGVVWRVKWPGGQITEHDLGVELVEPELVVSDALNLI